MVIFQVIPSDLDMFISCDYHVLSHKKEPRKDIYWSSTDHLLPNLPETHHVLTDFTMHLCDSILQLLENIFEEGLEISSVWSSKNAKMWLMISTYLNADWEKDLEGALHVGHLLVQHLHLGQVEWVDVAISTDGDRNSQPLSYASPIADPRQLSPSDLREPINGYLLGS